MRLPSLWRSYFQNEQTTTTDHLTSLSISSGDATELKEQNMLDMWIAGYKWENRSNSLLLYPKHDFHMLFPAGMPGVSMVLWKTNGKQQQQNNVHE